MELMELEVRSGMESWPGMALLETEEVVDMADEWAPMEEAPSPPGSDISSCMAKDIPNVACHDLPYLPRRQLTLQLN